MTNHPHRATASRKIIASWTREESVGIWDNLTATLTLYDDRAVYRGHTIRWHNNSGSLADHNCRIVGHPHAELLKLARDEAEDGADYTGEAFAIAAGAL